MDISQALADIRDHDSQQAFRFIYDCSYQRLFRIAVFYVGNDDDAEEIALDFLTNLWNERKSLLPPRNFATWSFVVVRNMAVNHLNKLRRHSSQQLDDSLPGDSLSPEEQCVDDELFQHYEDALASLPERCREVYSLVREEGHSYSEVAQMLSISSKTVDAQLQKAVRHLRSAISDYLSGASDGAKMLFSMLL